MQYFKSKIVTSGNETKRFRSDENMTVFSLGVVDDVEYLSVATDYPPDLVLAMQAPVCQCEEIDYDSFKSIAINSAIAKGIDDLVGKNIRGKYSENEEFKLVNKGISDPADEEYIQYREYVNSCRAWGSAKKTEYGIQ